MSQKRVHASEHDLRKTDLLFAYNLGKGICLDPIGTEEDDLPTHSRERHGE